MKSAGGGKGAPQLKKRCVALGPVGEGEMRPIAAKTEELEGLSRKWEACVQKIVCVAMPWPILPNGVRRFVGYRLACVNG